jgi:hypothetical protein
MKFLMLVVAIFALVFGAFAVECPGGLRDIQGVCGIPRTVNAACPDNTRYDVNKGICVLK